MSFVKAENFARAVEDLDRDDNQAVLDLVTRYELTYEDFRLLDEEPGRFYLGAPYTGLNWHRRLRIVRNDGSNDLFDRLRK